MHSKGTLLVTGSAGFIGARFVKLSLSRGYRVISVDKLTYASDLRRFEGSDTANRDHVFVEASVMDGARLKEIFREERPNAVIHFAAETHVDRSIDTPSRFLETNALGTAALLEATLSYFWDRLAPEDAETFRFLHISTDEVYGTAGGNAFTESSAFSPSSPYAASKAAAEHVVQAFHKTYGLPTLVVRPANTYGPWQFPEKLIPLMIAKALNGGFLPLYGDGRQRREWLYVEDLCDGVACVLHHGRVGEAYNLGGYETMENRTVIAELCALMDRRRPSASGRSYAEFIRHVEDRPGHDRCYAVDCGKAAGELDWRPETAFTIGLDRTLDWYLANEAWWREMLETRYDGHRLGRASHEGAGESR
jgi:dTDP-glucose 4,6-dehydratase